MFCSCAETAKDFQLLRLALNEIWTGLYLNLDDKLNKKCKS